MKPFKNKKHHAENWEFAKSPTKYRRRPVPEEFIDYMFARLSTAQQKYNHSNVPMSKLEDWWDSELAFQRHNDCPPNCTDFEAHQHPGIIPE